MPISKFIVHHGEIISEQPIVADVFDGELRAAARQALTQLREDKPGVTVSFRDGQEAVVQLGLPSFPRIQIPADSPVSPAILQQWEKASEQRKGTSFHVKTSAASDLYWISRDPVTDVEKAAVFGLVSGTFAAQQVRKPSHEREPFETKRPQIEQATARIVSGAPAFVTTGLLRGPAAEFADCFAAVMLSQPPESEPV